ncbi:hypothetical protein AUI51_02380 [archaeon 13_1_40CM_2_52_4]|nr:MAG: hypothetical protein AUI51_02380 [archaeon 13_1_40CM_2_52_4]TMI40382.1 MAG: hypothetical protein E6H21_06385 [Candidatus Bathyarchaeota archaeon]
MAVSAIDLIEKPQATKAWWFLFRALSEKGHEIVVLPFLGRPVDSPWWRSRDNPSKLISSILYSGWRGRSKSARTKAFYARHYRRIIFLPRFIISRRWRESINRAVAEEGPFDAAIFFSVPLNLLSTVPAHLRQCCGVPSVYYEADMPSILPSYGGIHFSYYFGADLSQFDGFLSDSDGVEEIVTKMGARNVSTLHWAADPKVLFPLSVEKDTDVFYTGGTSAFRQGWMDRMIREPSREMPNKIFAMSGLMKEHYENVKSLGFLGFDSWKRQICQSRICLNISRVAHASVKGTSSTRIFELASLGACIVSSPHAGLEKWFEPEKEIIVLHDNDRPADVYRRLLDSRQLMQELGLRARARVLEEHTYDHRAEQLLAYLARVI